MGMMAFAPPQKGSLNRSGAILIGPRRIGLGLIGAVLLSFSASSMAEENAESKPAEGPAVYKRLSLQELMNLEVTSVSRTPVRLTSSASAIQVITANDIRRSGAMRLPEALRLASNLQVDQIDSSQWAISSRGFKSTLANKMLVMIDGRSVYSPLFAGVFWDAQDVLLEDVERIEVISGPGATVWGANAVNGVISVTTKSARQTKGVFVEGGAGTELRGFGSLRYGAAIRTNLHFRLYGKYFDRDSSVAMNDNDADDDWYMGQGGFRVDWEASERDLVTLQGDLYRNRISLPGPDDAVTEGGNVLGRWSHTLSESANFQFQLYYDRIHRDVPLGNSFNDRLDTFDVDFQNRLALGEHHDVVWGAGYRLIEDDFGPRQLSLDPRRISLQTFSAFVQDEIALIRNRLHLTLGTKFEHNDYTGFEYQPSVRLAYNFTERQTLWGAVSRAVRTPSRLDHDLSIPPLVEKNSDFKSEELIAYELGYRVQPHERLAFSLAAFYHDYDDIRSVELVNPPAPVPLTFGNGQKGESYGLELTADYRLTEWWRVRAGFTELRWDIRGKAGSTDTSSGTGESADSEHHVSLRSSLDLPGDVEFDALFRYVSHVRNPIAPVPAYSELDLRLAWRPDPRFEFSVVGQNLLNSRHVEYGTTGTQLAVERSVYGKVTIRW